MATETAKRKQTLSVLDRLKSEGMPKAAKYSNTWSGEELPAGEEGAQDNFEADKARRVEQSMTNSMPEGAYKDVYGAVQGALGGVQPGATGLGAPTSDLGSQGMTPYSPEEFERRNSFTATEADKPLRTGVEALDQPPSRNKKPAKKKLAESDQADEPVDVNGRY